MRQNRHPSSGKATVTENISSVTKKCPSLCAYALDLLSLRDISQISSLPRMMAITEQSSCETSFTRKLTDTNRFHGRV
uniref:F-box domain-containing protein n=1 Tax=Steinernema glaseri TaxID=37863 RepID=A0A1I7YFJ7_9BILA